MAVDATPIEPSAPRRRVRAGATALLTSLGLVVWILAGLYLGVAASGSSAAGVAATVIFFLSWIVVPVAAIVSLAFAVVALLLNPVPGKIMGAVAIVLPFAAGLLFWWSLNGFGETLVGL